MNPLFLSKKNAFETEKLDRNDVLSFNHLFTSLNTNKQKHTKEAIPLYESWPYSYAMYFICQNYHSNAP